MKRIKRRTFAGSVCEQIVYNVRESTDTKRKNAQLINNNFSQTSYYSTLTFAVDYEVHTAEECRRERDNLYRRILYRYPSAQVYIVYGRGK